MVGFFMLGEGPGGTNHLGVSKSVVVCGIAGAALAAAWSPMQAATAVATVEATIINTITIATRNGIGFGDISSNAVAGTVIMAPSGSRTTTGGAAINTATAGSPAIFDLQGTANASFSITLPSSIVLSDGSANSMTVDGFTSTPSISGALDSSGQQTLFVGATLNVGSNQPFGSYNGQMTVTVDYN